MAEFIFQEITENQLPAALEIYNHYIANTITTFHIQPLGLREMHRLVFFKDPRYRTFAILDQKTVCGYVSLHRFRVREAYDGSAEISIYLRKDYVGRGLGNLALHHIEAVARKNKIHVLIATICGENERSINAFRKNGYIKCAHFKEVGKKFGHLLDSTCYQKILE